LIAVTVNVCPPESHEGRIERRRIVKLDVGPISAESHEGRIESVLLLLLQVPVYTLNLMKGELKVSYALIFLKRTSRL